MPRSAAPPLLAVQHAQLTPISRAEAAVCMKQVTEATRRGWILLLLVLTARCQACEAGSAAGATSWRKTGVLNSASYANVARHSNRCCRIDEAARSVLGLRGGSGASVGGSPSNASGGRAHDVRGNMITRCGYLLRIYRGSISHYISRLHRVR